MPHSSLIVLDRDGVINEDSDDFIKSPDEWQPIPGSLEAISRLSHAGWQIVVATNQSGVARGIYSLDVLHAIHHKMHLAVQAAGGRISAVFFCPHMADANCTCRKPRTGLLEDIAQRTGRSLEGVAMVGDSLRDLQAGHAMKMALHLVKTGKGERTLTAATASTDKALPEGTQVHDSLGALAHTLLGDA